MKRLISLLILLSMCILLSSCSKSEAVKATEEAISQIGEVTLESIDSIENAERLYGVLTDKEKEAVNNRNTLIDARKSFDDLSKEQIYKNAELSDKSKYSF